MWASPEHAAGGGWAGLETVLHQPPSLILYLATALVVGLHLLHGAEAAHRNPGVESVMQLS